MKILSTKQIKEVDSKTIAYDGISSKTLMTRAVQAIYKYLKDNYLLQSKTNIICGVGNNGGDGIALAIELYNSGNDIKVYVIEHSKNYSPDFKHFLERATDRNIDIKMITSIDQLPNFPKSEIIIDAIFGTGLNREVKGLALEVINKLNVNNTHTISIDVPSGLMLNGPTTTAIKANITITLQIPKLALFLPDNHKYVGNLAIVNMGLSTKAINEAETTESYIDKEHIKSIIKPLNKYAHKGTQGHSLIIGGSIGKIGSVHLASKAALKSGCGLVTAYVPKCGTVPLQTSFPEAMVIEDINEEFLSKINYLIYPNAIGIGVGMGTNDITKDAFIEFIKNNKSPMVIDADAINIISEHKEILELLPQNTIITPHPKELSRLVGDWSNDFEKIEKVTNIAKAYNIIVVIKGAHTLIITSEELYVNSSGTPALATAGSGDVLTGIITGLLAQGYSALQAAKIGVYLHGLTANISATTINPRSFVASDIIDNIGKAYFDIEGEG